MILVSGHKGYGDNLYMRPFVQALRERDEVTIATPWPELHPGCRYVRTGTSLRHAERNEAQHNDYGPAPKGAREIHLEYVSAAPRLSIMQALSEKAGVSCDTLSLPAKPEPYLPGPYAVFHPPTIRQEYKNPARNPDPASFRFLLDEVQKYMPLIAFADLRGEQVEGEYAYDRGHMNGQMPLHRLPGLLKAATLVITSPCFMLPMAMSVGARTIAMFGGYWEPSVLIPPGNEVTVLAPEPFCKPCHQTHTCKKEIERERIQAAVDSLVSVTL